MGVNDFTLPSIGIFGDGTFSSKKVSLFGRQAGFFAERSELAMMARLNIRHELPQIGIRQHFGRLEEASVIQPVPHAKPKSYRQSSLDLDSYPSRKAYGARNMDDFTAERGQRGFSDVSSATSRHTQRGWENAETAARRGNNIPQNAKAEMFSKYRATILFRMEFPPDVLMQGHPGEIVGDTSIDIETAPSARIRYTPGSVEFYLKNEGFLRQWVSDRYETYA